MAQVTSQGPRNVGKKGAIFDIIIITCLKLPGRPYIAGTERVRFPVLFS